MYVNNDLRGTSSNKEHDILYIYNHSHQFCRPFPSFSSLYLHSSKKKLKGALLKRSSVALLHGIMTR